MGVAVGAKWTGSMTFTSGQEDEDRWIFAGNQVAKTLTIQETGPALPTIANMVGTDRTGFSALALHTKFTKTVSGEDTLDFTEREMYAWGGTDEGHVVGLSYGGTNAYGAVFIMDGYEPSAAHGAYDKILFAVNKLAADNMQAGNVLHTWIPIRSSEFSPFTAPIGYVGVHLRLHLAATAITTTNTWTVEMTWCYWF